MASPQSVLPCPWLAFRDTPRRLPATRTNGPNVPTGHPDVATRKSPASFSSQCDRVARPMVVPTPCDVATARLSDDEADLGWDQRRITCTGGCVAGAVGPIPGDPPGPAFHHRSGERQDPQAIPWSPLTRPPKWTAEAGASAIRTTRILAASPGRESGPQHPRGCRRSSPRATPGRSQQPCSTSPSDVPPETPKRSRKRPR